MPGNDFTVTAGWGDFDSGDAVMPGTGRAVERRFTSAERATSAFRRSATPPSTSGSTTAPCWRNVPAAVWHYRLGGYQVLKK